MSHIPETAMKHAHVHDDHAAGDHADRKPANAKASSTTPTDKDLVREDPTLGEKAIDVAERAKDAVLSHPKTAIGIGAAVVAGIAAAVAAPAVIAKVKEKDEQKNKGADPKKPASKKPPKAK